MGDAKYDLRTTPPGSDEFFDLSVVTDPEVGAALNVLLVEWRMRKRWADFPATARRLHQHILRTYLLTGMPPERKDLSQLDMGDPQGLLADLVDRDLVFLDGEEIAGAYPFSTRPTRHSVTIEGQLIQAVCAIDALGAGAMARRSVKVKSCCPVCETEIVAMVGEGGLLFRSASPSSAVVWAGVALIDRCAVDTQCQTMLFFCSDNHLQEWRTSQTGVSEGYRFSPEQGLQAGAAIFRPFLPGSCHHRGV